MLASSFRTAEELKCSEADRAAAIKVLHMLESGEIKSIKFNEVIIGKRLLMSDWSEERLCGTVACIGGWMEIVKGGDLDFSEENEEGDVHGYGFGSWNDVFYPPDWCYRLFTVEEAAVALRAKLETGKATWPKQLVAKDGIIDIDVVDDKIVNIGY